MSVKRPAPVRKFFFIQKWGTYTNETPVFVGYTNREILARLKQIGAKEEVIKLWEKECTTPAPVFVEKSKGSMWFDGGYSLLRMPDFEDDWDHLDTLIHECFHAVIHCLGKMKGFINETSGSIEHEGLAYAHEHLFREMRRKLQDEYWRKGRVDKSPRRRQKR